jgi:glyoxylase I family protein
MPHNKSLAIAFHHCSLIVANTDNALNFYAGILGLKVDESRPEMAYPGAWLNIAGGQIHLLELPNPDPVDERPEHGGRDRHLALTVSSLNTVIQRLEQENISYSKSKSGRKALFCRDYDGNAIELIES